jgi:UDP-glucose 4-epimerase
MKSVLVVGGAGYIGSACVALLCDQGLRVTVFDNFSRGDRRYVDSRAVIVEGDALDRDSLFSLLSDSFDSVIHFAAHKDARASMTDLVRYSENIRITINVLDFIVARQISKIIFSSTAAVYGMPTHIPIAEDHQLEPINYYGFTKLSSEQIIGWYAEQYDFYAVILRYFNVAGDAGLHYRETDASNLFPRVIDAIEGRLKSLPIFGDTYPTSDGTCIRDYIHVRDLVSAHVLALHYNGTNVFNLGSRDGYSVLEVIASFEKLLERSIPYHIEVAREGDPARVIASSQKARDVMGWEAEYDLDAMVKSTLEAYDLL